MRAGEESTPAKPSKPPSSTQEISATPSYPGWSNSMQAYYGAGGTPPFFASNVPSPTPHPYLWGSQHPLIPPYGTLVPYPALYPAGGVYAHPNMATTTNSAQAIAEYEGKGSDRTGKASAKKSKGTAAGKAGESANEASGSGNEGASQSGESGSHGSSDASDEDINHKDFAANKKGIFDQMLADANAQNNDSGATVPGNSVVSMPATNLNIGMDLWSAYAPGAAKIGPIASTGSSAITPAVMPEQWIQDERELKRQKRKQSNRESARRSRLRKQAECEELQARVETLTSENRNLRDELQRLSEECNKLKSDNDSIEEELTRLFGADAVANLEQSNHTTVKSRVDEGNG